MLLTVNVLASADNIRFERISLHAGLSQQTVISIYQDSRGYMWFGTQEGLNKYDGVNFTSYQPKYNDPYAISSGWIYSITEDDSGNIWVGTKNGVNILDVTTDKFVHHTSGSDYDSINDVLVRVVHKDRKGTMWVATRKGINQYIANEKRFKHHNFFGSEDNTVIDIVSVVEDITGALWLGSSNQGLLRFDPASEALTVVSSQFSIKDKTQKVGVRSLFLDDAQVLWIGTNRGDLFELDLKKPRVENIAHAVRFVSHFDGKRVMAIGSDQRGTLWVGTNIGMYYKKAEGDSFIFLKNRPNASSKLADDEIWSLYSDFSGVLWVGTFNGLNKWNTRTTQFDHFYASDSDSRSLSSNQVGMISGNGKGTIFVGTRAGVDLLDPISGKVQSLPIESAGNAGLKEPRVMSFAYVSDEEIWFGYRTSGATKYNSVNNTYKHYTANPSDSTALQVVGVTSIIHSATGVVWFGTFNGGISRYNRDTDDFTSFLHDPTDISTLSSNKVISLYESSDGNLWVGTWDSGLSIFVPSTGTAFRVQRKDNDPDTLGSNTVVSFVEDSDNNMWVGTHGGGLNFLAHEQKEKGSIVFDKLDTEKGMPSNVVYGLLEDNDGYIWSSTNKGLAKIDRATKDVIVYNVTKGIQGDEFNSGTYYKDTTGHLYFGGNNGVTRFNPEDIKPNPTPPKIDFTTFQRLNKFDNIDEVLNADGEIEVFYQDYLIGFEFAALDYASPIENQYTYKLEGFDKDWINVRDSRRATYTNLPSGSYKFMVRAANSDGIWNQEGKSIALVVNPPPWLSWWAYAIYTILILAAVLYAVLVIKRRTKTREDYKTHLKHEVDIRTSELQEANEQLLQASITDQLTGLHNRRYLADVINDRLENINLRFAQSILDDKMSYHSGPRLMALMFDLDGFKPVNDNYGHEAGDKVIVQVADILRNESSEDDIVVRWGGDEYMVVAEVKDLEHAQHIAEKIRLSIASHAFDVGLSNKFHLSSSLGFALYPFSHYAPHSITWDQVHLLADHALYKSKAAGRNTWTGISQSNKELPFSILNSLVPNVDKAIDTKDVIVVHRAKKT
jgi:diguanylate cyclase (GGDEF)-like protein